MTVLNRRQFLSAKNLDENIGLPLNETTLATHLKPAGYATACMGWSAHSSWYEY